ncbi:hypothetical protein F5877DRAFT_68850 [Lentinula edodes]|nr:hypothetical protein F5877DRAFT_68850 [Lentinula edodes]
MSPSGTTGGWPQVYDIMFTPRTERILLELSHRISLAAELYFTSPKWNAKEYESYGWINRGNFDSPSYLINFPAHGPYEQGYWLESALQHPKHREQNFNPALGALAAGKCSQLLSEN